MNKLKIVDIVNRTNMVTKADEERKKILWFRVHRGNNRRLTSMPAGRPQLGSRIEEIAAEYVGCSEKWFSLGFGAAFRLVCISSPGGDGGFFPRRSCNVGDVKRTRRYGSALPLSAIALNILRRWRVRQLHLRSFKHKRDARLDIEDLFWKD